nr:MAG TPA: hypothetical protein [Caudoviricetes sp.]
MFSQSYVGPPLMEETHAVVGRRVSPSIHLGRGYCMKGKEERKMIFEKRKCFSSFCRRCLGLSFSSSSCPNLGGWGKGKNILFSVMCVQLQPIINYVLIYHVFVIVLSFSLPWVTLGMILN